LGSVINGILPPSEEVFEGTGDMSLNVILVASRWEYGSRFNSDGFEYRRFLPALRRVAKTVSFVPIEATNRIVKRILTFALRDEITIVLSVFQNLDSIPHDYFKLTEQGCYLANWHTDDDMLFDRFSRHIAGRFSLNITTFEPNLARYKAIDAGAVASQWAGINGCNFLDSRRYAACFVGRMYGHRADLIKRLRYEFGDKVFLHDTRVKPISDEAMISAYQNSWLAIDDPMAFDGKTKQIKARVFENASMGCLVATNPNSRIEKYYTPGREILFWETITDLIRSIRSVISHPEDFRKTARLAYERTLREHLYEHRFKNVFSCIMEGLTAVL
jgi:spore maturation protein CgeB